LAATVAVSRWIKGKAMLDLLSTPVGMLWLAVAFVAIMAGMLAAAPE
jgi:hypothetical protein